MSKQIPGRYANEGFFAYLRRLINEYPNKSITELRAWAKGTTRIRCSGPRHQGKNECARRVNQMQRGVLQPFGGLT